MAPLDVLAQMLVAMCGVETWGVDALYQAVRRVWAYHDLSRAAFDLTLGMLAGRYAGNTAVIGADLHNEPYNGTWGGGGANDWAAAAERAGNAIGEEVERISRLSEQNDAASQEAFQAAARLEQLASRMAESVARFSVAA